mgnify:CR=1 FL=1
MLDTAGRYSVVDEHRGEWFGFLDLLKNHIRTFGTIEMKQLFEQPFTSVNSQGVIGVFTDMAQVVALKTIVEGFTVNTGKAAL